MQIADDNQETTHVPGGDVLVSSQFGIRLYIVEQVVSLVAEMRCRTVERTPNTVVS